MGIKQRLKLKWIAIYRNRIAEEEEEKKKFNSLINLTTSLYIIKIQFEFYYRLINILRVGFFFL